MDKEAISDEEAIRIEEATRDEGRFNGVEALRSKGRLNGMEVLRGLENPRELEIPRGEEAFKGREVFGSENQAKGAGAWEAITNTTNSDKRCREKLAKAVSLGYGTLELAYAKQRSPIMRCLGEYGALIR